MDSDTTLSRLISEQNFEDALQRLAAGDKIPDDISGYEIKNLFAALAGQDQLTMLNLLADRGEIPLDLYEYDTFDGTIIEALFRNFPEKNGCSPLLSFLSKFKNLNEEVDSYSLLSYALEKHASPLLINCLIAAGCNINYKNNAENNLIIQAVQLNMLPLNDQLAYLETFIGAGIDVNEPNVENKTALHIAIERDKNKLAQTLLDAGADPALQDWKGNTAFYYTLGHFQDKELYQQLANASTPDFTIQNNEGQTALSEFLKRMQGSEKDTALFERLIDDGADPEQTAPYYDKQKSAWDWAVEKPIEVLQMLLQKTGKDVNEPDNDGNTLLHKICAFPCNYSANTAKELYKKAKLLLELGANAGNTNNKDETPVMLALTDNMKTKLVELLIKAEKK